MTPEERLKYLAQFDMTAAVEYNGWTYRLTEEDLIPHNNPGDPTSTWYKCSLIGRAKSKMSPTLGRFTVLTLVAQTLKTTVEELESAMDWNANYMAWHDGGDVYENHVWPIGEGEKPASGDRKSDG